MKSKATLTCVHEAAAACRCSCRLPQQNCSEKETVSIIMSRTKIWCRKLTKTEQIKWYMTYNKGRTVVLNSIVPGPFSEFTLLFVTGSAGLRFLHSLDMDKQ